MPEGTVKFFDTEKCFGFIETEDHNELYVHAGDLINLVKKNDLVSFEVQTENNKKSAFNVKIISKKR